MPIFIGSWSALACAVVLGAAAIVRTFRRHGPEVSALISAGIFAFVLAAGNIAYLAPGGLSVCVMVDLSSSTRDASYRQAEILQRRVQQLLGDAPYDVVFFADRNEAGFTGGSGELPEMAAARTVFASPPCDAVVLFSDGRFSNPNYSPPVYPVLDPGLENTGDAAITSMQYSGNQLAVSVANSGRPRTLTLHGTLGAPTETIAGSRMVVRPLDPAATRIWAELAPGDAWPENDSLSIPPPPPPPTERWWVGANSPDGWRRFAPETLPTDATAYLSASVIVLNNISADRLSLPAQQSLQQYVRDLGGSAAIFGGDAAFAAGGYAGTILESLSPMSSSPPTPRTQWIILADASGSMNQSLTPSPPHFPTPPTSRWAGVTAAIVQLLPSLPPADPVRVGQFSDNVRWWSEGKTAGETAKLPLPPADAIPHGPTNLQPVLEAIASGHSAMPTEVILLTDADVELDDPPALARRLATAHVRLHLLAIDRGSGLADLEDVVRDTGGGFLTQLDFSRWADSVRQLLAGALPDPVSTQPVTVQFIGPASAIDGGTTETTDSAWPKPHAIPIARTGDGILAAAWHVGSGQVLAAAFAPTLPQQTGLADLVAQPPRDQRLNVSWQSGPTPRVTIDAVDGRTYLNKLDLTLELWDQQSNSSQPIPQVGPGRYELDLPFAARPAIATIRQGERVIERLAVSGGYAEEFAGIGEDRGGLEQLARSSGGNVIPPTQTTPIDFHWPRKPIPLTPYLAALGSFLVAAGLILPRWSASASGST